MSSRLPFWIAEVVKTFNPDDAAWFQKNLLPLIEKRNAFREELGEKPISQQTLKNVLSYLKVCLLRKYGAELISLEFRVWLATMDESKELNKCDIRLLEMVTAQQNSPQELLKIQREIKAKIKRSPKKYPLVGNQFVTLSLLKPSFREILLIDSQRKKTKKKKQRK